MTQQVEMAAQPQLPAQRLPGAPALRPRRPALPWPRRRGCRAECARGINLATFCRGSRSARCVLDRKRGQCRRRVQSPAVNFPTEGEVLHFKKVKANAHLELTTSTPETWVRWRYLAVALALAGVLLGVCLKKAVLLHYGLVRKAPRACVQVTAVFGRNDPGECRASCRKGAFGLAMRGVLRPHPCHRGARAPRGRGVGGGDAGCDLTAGKAVRSGTRGDGWAARHAVRAGAGEGRGVIRDDESGGRALRPAVAHADNRRAPLIDPERIAPWPAVAVAGKLDVRAVGEDLAASKYSYESAHFAVESDIKLPVPVVRDITAVFEATRAALIALPLGLLRGEEDEKYAVGMIPPPLHIRPRAESRAAAASTMARADACYFSPEPRDQAGHPRGGGRFPAADFCAET